MIRNTHASTRKKITQTKRSDNELNQLNCFSSKRLKIMQSSNQTDLERRVLRQAQRSLHQRMERTQSSISEELKDIVNNTFHDIRQENNALFKKVRYTREAALDGDNIYLISEKASRQLDKLVQVPRYNSNHIARKLRKKNSVLSADGTSCSFDWKTFGRECGSCFNAVPTFRLSFLAGPIHDKFVPKVRKSREYNRYITENIKEEIPEEINQTKGSAKDGNKLSAVEKLITVMTKKLKCRCYENHIDLVQKFEKKHGVYKNADPIMKKRAGKILKNEKDRVCLVKFLFNPKSFTQTVENIFGFSFLIKKGIAACGIRTENDCIKLDESSVIDKKFLPGPWIKSSKEESEVKDSVEETSQTIISLSMQDWRELVKLFKVRESDIPHRSGTRQVMDRSSSISSNL